MIRPFEGFCVLLSAESTFLGRGGVQFQPGNHAGHGYVAPAAPAWRPVAIAVQLPSDPAVGQALVEHGLEHAAPWLRTGIGVLGLGLHGLAVAVGGHVARGASGGSGNDPRQGAPVRRFLGGGGR